MHYYLVISVGVMKCDFKLFEACRQIIVIVLLYSDNMGGNVKHIKPVPNCTRVILSVHISCVFKL